MAGRDWLDWARASPQEHMQIPAGAADAPTLAFLPALQRRRLSRPARLALQAAHDCLAGERADHIIFNDDSPSSSLSARTESLSQACWEAAA